MKNISFRTMLLKGKDGATITSIEKLEAEGGVMKMRIHLSDGTHVDFDVNDVPDTDLINNLIDIALVPLQSDIDDIKDVFNVTIRVSDWDGEGPDYEALIAQPFVSGQNEYEIVGFVPGGTTEATVEIKRNAGLIVYGESGTNTLTFYAYGKKPTGNITLIIRRIVRRE